MTEQEYIAQESEKHKKRLKQMLRRIEVDGRAGRDAEETLLVNGFIQFGGPTERIKYNHYRLTDAGMKVFLD